jgi:hypothetical protein
MRNFIVITISLLLMLVGLISLAPTTADSSGGTTIQDGTLTYSTGHYLEDQPLMTGYDPFGYNYQAHMFSESYANAYLGRDGLPPYEGDDAAYLAANPGAASKWYWPYRDTDLAMKWNDPWLSNMDCDGDGLLDRHYGYNTYTDSGAWLTNHQKGEYDMSGKTIHWNYYVKIITPDSTCTKSGGIWYDAGGTEIGYVIWGSFAIIQQIENDAGIGAHGVSYNSPSPSGFGYYK